MLKSVFEISYFTKKTSVKNFCFSKFQRPDISYRWLCGYRFWLVLRHLNVLSRKCSFGTLVNMAKVMII